MSDQTLYNVIPIEFITVENRFRQDLDIEPMANPLDAVQRLRPDEVTESDQRELFQAIAPATENGLYLVPKVID